MFVANNFENVTAEIHVDQDTLLLKDQNNQILYDGPYSTFDPGSLPFGGQFTPQSRRIENPGKVFLYDNGPANGTNGYSNATDVPFGSFRYLLDDFNVPEGESWSITDFHWRHIWTTIPDGVGPGTGILLEFWPDGGNCTPVDAPLATANVTSYTEVTTGNVFFSRNEKESSVEFDKIKLPPGHYWFHATIIGPENNFWLTANQNKCECWVDYADFAGLISGTAQFCVASDLSWQITGRVQPLGGCIPPDTYTVFRGIVLPPPPTLQTFADEDGEVACYNPGFTINDQESPVTLDFEATNSDAIDGTVSVTSTAGTPGIGVRALCWQWPNGPFVQVGEQWDETFNSIAKHEFGPVPPGCVEQNTGRVRWRLEWRKKGFTINFPWKVTVDATGVCAR